MSKVGVVFLNLTTIVVSFAVFCKEVDASTVALSKADLVHGEAQIELMLRDRPRMSECVRRGDPVWGWTVQHFAGDGMSHRIYWNNAIGDNPISYNAESHYPTKYRRGSISIRRIDAHGDLLDCEELWKCAVFELCNVRNGPDFHAIYLKALRGQLTEDEFIRQNMAIEFRTSRDTTKFYQSVWSPWALKNNLQSHSEVWFADDPNTFVEWSSGFTDKNAYPWNSWGNYFKTKIVPYRKAVEAQSRNNKITRNHRMQANTE